ncbi:MULTISPECIES: GntR family transcriptional regulator [Protofrankia]|uniref:Transcriptional regulator, GntR family n=1 Tax=Candidatus Protofrankia datiscae TaxID=2716812 RepID=F8AZA5_9ACTN|nr:MULTISPECIES: GntR family transcriptional regulator [Protofrankia]AEH11634.1 transcriptional regulator, GntR family [Candidatus Protofrankia datiscae]
MPTEMEGQTPPYARIADHFRTLIQTGELAPDNRLPSIRDISTTFNVARQTAANALSSLESEGLIKILPRSGAVVVGPRKAESELAVIVELASDMKVTSADTLKASGELAHHLGIDEGSPILIVRLRRL